MANSLGTLLRTAREAKGLTQAQVGAHVGITYSAVGQYESGSIKNPRPDRIAAIAELLEIDREMLNRRLSESYGITSPGTVIDLMQVLRRSVSPKRSTISEIEPAPDAPPLRGSGGARDVEELGVAVGGEDGDFEMNGEVVDYVPRPAALAKRDVFAVRVKNDSMEPRFYEGHLLYVDRKRQPGAGDDAVVELWPIEPDRAGRAFIKQLLSKGMATVVVRQFNPPKEITFDREKVKALYRVVPNNELFGV